jgi:hypothetical protein
MTAIRAVADGKLTNEELGFLTRRFDEIKRRLGEGTLLLPIVMMGLQDVVEDPAARRDFSTSWNMPIGVYRSANEYVEAMDSKGMIFTVSAGETLCNLKLVGKVTLTNLVVVSAADLGLIHPKDILHKYVCARGMQMGLGFCHDEVGPALRVAYTDQPSNEKLVIIMETVRDRTCSPNVFIVENCDGKMWLRCARAHPDTFWPPGAKFVFSKGQPG